MRRCLEHKNISKTTDRMGIDMKRRGFSLIELLVTVLITSIIVIAAYQLLTSTANSFGDEDNRRLLEANLRNAELLIQRDISRTGYSYGYTADDGNGRMQGGACRAARLSVGFSGMNAFKPVAFKHATDGTNSKIQIIASISDYDDFTVSSYSNGTVTLDRTVTLPLVANQVYKSSVDGSNLSNTSADDGTFAAIFNRVFRNASAVEISTPDTGTAIAAIDSIKDGQFNFIGNTQDFTRYCGIDPERPFVENTVNPIIAIVYRLNAGRLERCISSVIGDDFGVDENKCDVLLENVEYFQVYPILKSEFNKMDFPTDKTVGEAWNTVTISQLYGAMFRIGAKARSSLKTLPSSGDKYTGSDGEVYLYSHAHGAALFQEPRNGNVTLPTKDSKDDVSVAHGAIAE